MTEPLEAGRELDVLVAEKVMGWRPVSDGAAYFWPTPEMAAMILKQYPDVLAVDYFPAPEFSTEIAAAWTVVEKLTGRSMNRQARMSLVNDWFSQEWTCAFFGTGNPLLGGSGGHKAATAPLAICRAALAAAGAEDPPMQRLPIGEPGQFIKVKP